MPATAWTRARARTPATEGLGPTTAETHSTAWVSATALTRARARTPVTVVPTIEETPAKVWVLAKASNSVDISNNRESKDGYVENIVLKMLHNLHGKSGTIVEYPVGYLKGV